jgi:hypothetical protein
LFCGRVVSTLNKPGGGDQPSEPIASPVGLSTSPFTKPAKSSHNGRCGSGIATLLPHRAHAPRRGRTPTVAILTRAGRRVKPGRTTIAHLAWLRRLLVQPTATLSNQSPKNHQISILLFHNHSVTTTYTTKKIAFPVFRRNKMLDNVIVLLNLVFVRANILEVGAEYW